MANCFALSSHSQGQVFEPGCTRYCACGGCTNGMMTRGTPVAVSDWVRGSRRSNHRNLCPMIGNDWLRNEFVGSKKERMDRCDLCVLAPGRNV
ncbi:hypothetical protein Tco_1076932 [Tanacetum coccineum]